MIAWISRLDIAVQEASIRLAMRAYLLGIILLLTACTTATPTVWARPDGRPVDPAQLQLDQTACRGEMEKARLSEKEEKIYFPGEQNPLTAVFVGCMAQHGYLARP